METVAVFEQPFDPMPVTVYVVVADGVAETIFPVNNPGSHVYVFAPVPVSVVLLPEQSVFSDADAATVGRGSTVMATVAVLVQPAPFVPVTV